MSKHISILIILAWTLAALLAGCHKETIPGTDIALDDERRAVWQVVERYRQAVEERDVDAIMALVSTEYFDNAGTTDTNEDDYGYPTLRERVLPVLRENIRKVHFDIRVRSLEVHGNRAYVEYEYFLRFLYSEGGKDGWVTKNDFNRLELVREDGTWKIVSGL